MTSDGFAAIAPGVRVAYVDNDPIVHVHASALLTGSGATAIVLAALHEPGTILAHPQITELIDFGEPVGLLLVAVLHFVTDRENPAAIVATLRDALPGSYLALSHATGDFRTHKAATAAAVYDHATSALTLRSHAQIARFLDGFDILDPGLVQLPLWRPDAKPPRDASAVLGYGARRPQNRHPQRSPATVKMPASWGTPLIKWHKNMILNGCVPAHRASEC